MLTLTDVHKSFGPTYAVDGVSLSITPGEILGLVGENGAGKTTLMRIVAGELSPDAGVVTVQGTVQMVHQHFLLVPAFTIAENLALASTSRFRFASSAELATEAQQTIEATGIALGNVSRRVDELSVGEKSKLELIKALSREPRLLILDEPTSVLTPAESNELFDVVRRRAGSGTAVVFISHKLPEVLAIATRVVVMRSGRVVHETDAAAATPAELADAMVGRAPREPGAQNPSPPPVSASGGLDIHDLAGERLDGASITVRAGEIAAVVGVAGNGQAELAAVLRGLSAPRSGRIVVGGRVLSPRELRRARRIAHIPEDRTRDGIVAEMSIAENVALAATRWRPRHSDRVAAASIAAFDIRAHDARQPVGELSGGNQQKVLLARELSREPEVVVAAEPTRGLDIEAARFVHGQLRAAAARGAAVLLITSDLDEAFELAGSFHVIYRGRTSGPLSPDEARARAAALMAGIA